MPPSNPESEIVKVIRRLLIQSKRRATMEYNRQFVFSHNYFKGKVDAFDDVLKIIAEHTPAPRRTKGVKK